MFSALFRACRRSMPNDLCFALRCLCAAGMIMLITLTPLAQAVPPTEEAAVPVSLNLQACALSDDMRLDLLARVIAAEMGSRSYAAQVAFGAMLCNRLADPRYPTELGAVLSDAGLRAVSGDIPTRAMRAARAALLGVDPSAGATVCYARTESPPPHFTATAEFDGIIFGRE
ncbi:MAG: hypothetical protein IKD37_07580 [Clostridia bacterium]|nr:hypothetical protein [Clostridia bacterium]